MNWEVAQGERIKVQCHSNELNIKKSRLGLGPTYKKTSQSVINSDFYALALGSSTVDTDTDDSYQGALGPMPPVPPVTTATILSITHTPCFIATLVPSQQ